MLPVASLRREAVGVLDTQALPVHGEQGRVGGRELGRLWERELMVLERRMWDSEWRDLGSEHLSDSTRRAGVLEATRWVGETTRWAGVLEGTLYGGGEREASGLTALGLGVVSGFGVGSAFGVG